MSAIDHSGPRPVALARRTVWIIAMFLLSSCTGLRYSTKQRPLYTGFTLEWTEKPVFDAVGARQELEELVKPDANNSILGLRPTVALHNGIKEPKKQKGIKHWLRNKIGSEPVYLDALPLADINKAMVNRLNNRGYFGALSSYAVVPHGKRASVVFTVTPGAPHLISSIRMGDPANGGLDSTIALQVPQCPIRIGEPYDLARLTAERSRVVDRMRDKGWYRLRDDDLIWATDTARGNKSVALHLRVKPTTPSTKRSRYTIGSVTVHSDQDEVLPPMDTVMVDSVKYISYLDSYRSAAILRGVYVRPATTYSLARTTAMQNYLTSYGVFRNVLVTHSDDTLRSGVLNSHITLQPLKRFSLFSEASMVSKSNNFAGPGVRAGFKDRNFLGGAEQFTLDINGRFETQISGADQGTNAYEVGIKAGLAIPRMLLLPEPKGIRTSAPITNLTAGFGLFRRINLYGMRSASAGWGHMWKSDLRTWHDLQLLEFSFNQLYYTSADFSQFLQENPTIQRSFEDQFIVGVGYTYTHSTKKRDTQRDWFVYSLGADESGNLLNAIYGVKGARPEEGYILFGQRFSQYVRLRPEVRWYHALGGRGDQLVTRFLSQAGIAYGNTEVMPYVKQFYTGGTNSLRGFRARSVGPGSYISPQNDNLLVDQVGDLKLEANMEYRFGLSGIVKGALFADVGNVWLLNEDPTRPGGAFKWDTFVSELAVDAGIGLRVDPQVIVIRLDLAAPLRRPDLPAGDRWVFDDL
ncbi:MAG: BamA/TamA family outer membrane protein [Flavobacteriales bacterium]|nr:BamA/TamA family outer membrane protein [Flavobacteriales bacterium]